MLSNFHTHCYFCHGEGSPEEYVEQALKKGFPALGFTCHAPAPFVTSWNMSVDNAEKYVIAIDSLKNKYKNQIQIYKGMEIDYLKKDTQDRFLMYDLDYKIGSVHFVIDETGNNYIGIDTSLKTFEESLKTYFNSDIKKLVFEYYDSILEMLKYNKFDILGHLDLVKKNNKGQKFFNETEKWYTDLLQAVVEQISKFEVIVEINTGGISRGYTDDTYPSEWIIRELKKWNIPIILSSDAHNPQNIDFYFEESKKMIKSIGYNETWELDNGKWVSKPL